MSRASRFFVFLVVLLLAAVVAGANAWNASGRIPAGYYK